MNQDKDENKYYKVSILVTSDISTILSNCGVKVEFIFNTITENYIITGVISDAIRNDIMKLKEVRSITMIGKVKAL